MKFQSEISDAWNSLLNVKNEPELLTWIENLGGDESTHLEFKSQVSHDHIVKTCSAFANARGGILLIGVIDSPVKEKAKNPSTSIRRIQEASLKRGILSIIDNGFYYTMPLHKVEYLEKLNIFAIAVWGLEREPILYLTKDRAISGARRKGASSHSFSVEETLATANRWQGQREAIIARYECLPDGEKVTSADLKRFGTVAFYINSLPVMPFAEPVGLASIDRLAEKIGDFIPQGLYPFYNNRLVFGYNPSTEQDVIRLHRFCKARIIQSGMLKVTAGCRQNDSIDDIKKIVLTALYYGISLLRLMDDSDIWAIQGKYTLSGGTTMHIQDPTVLSLRQFFMDSLSTMPEIGSKIENVSESEYTNALRLICRLDDFLGLQLNADIDWQALESNPGATKSKVLDHFIFE